MKGIDFSKLETWVHGLVAALLTGIGITGSDYIASLIDGTSINWHHLGAILTVSCLGAAFLYLRQSPLPPLGSLTIQGPGNVNIPEGSTATIVTPPVASTPTPVMTDFRNLPSAPNNPTKAP